MEDELELLRGTLDLLVLKALVWGPRHGYAVTEWIRATSDDEFHIEDGALYQALHRLEDRGLVDATWGASANNRRAKFYRLTVAGRNRLQTQARHWDRYVKAVGRVLTAEEES